MSRLFARRTDNVRTSGVCIPSWFGIATTATTTATAATTATATPMTIDTTLIVTVTNTATATATAAFGCMVVDPLKISTMLRITSAGPGEKIIREK